MKHKILTKINRLTNKTMRVNLPILSFLSLIFIWSLLINISFVLSPKNETIYINNTEIKTEISEKIIDNPQLVTEIQLLNNKNYDLAKELQTCNGNIDQLKLTAESIASRINNRVGIIWVDQGYMVQIHPDAQVNEVMEEFLAKSVDDETKNNQLVEIQKINPRSYFLTHVN